MSHMVTFTSMEGKKGYHQCEELDDALRFVERLRNNEGVTDSQVFRMDEVLIEVKQYYKVEAVNPAQLGAPPMAAAAPMAPLAPVALAPVEAHPVEVPLDHHGEPVPAMASMPELQPDGRPSFSIFTKS